MEKEDLEKEIEKYYGFKRDLIVEPEQCGLWSVRFTVNGIHYMGSVPYYGAKPQLSVCGYDAYMWRGTPVTEDYYKNCIEGRTICLIHLRDKEAGDWEYTGVTFPDKEAAEEYIRNLENAEDYTYDLDYREQERGRDGSYNKV